jgi:putative radical SAM enzyme (TIGR03279 family)
MATKGLRIRKVDPEALGARAGLRSGDEILAVNGRPVPDELALKFHLAEEQVELTLRKPGGGEERIDIDLSDGSRLGIEVEDFETRTCNNSCLFCFVDQLPPNVRPGLKVRDDDYRLSFLHGNYITLTNLSERELDRIIEQALSPLYVSVHATDPSLRTRILGRKKADDLHRKLHQLIEGGIRINAQIVLLPEINDGEHLRKTVFDLYEYYPGVSSVAIVPVGLSAHGKAKYLFKPVTAAFSSDVIRQVAQWQESFRREIDRTFAYLADEFYILGGVAIPNSSHYDDFTQIEDGVGMVRRFLDDFDEAIRQNNSDRPALRGTLVTGRLFEPFLRVAACRLNACLSAQIGVVAADNHFLGRAISVAGLLSGQDIISALSGTDPGDFVVIPDDSISRADGVFIDDLTLPEMSRITGRPVYPGGRNVREFFKLVCEEL